MNVHSSPDYKCSKCGRSECKLWREAYEELPKLLCAECAGKDQNKSITDMDSEGRIPSKYGLTDNIGWYLPAVPYGDGTGYWGYTTAPLQVVTWWQQLAN